jgi:hypothetical protein
VFQSAGLKLFGAATAGEPYLARLHTLENGWSLRLPLALLGPLEPVEPDGVLP